MDSTPFRESMASPTRFATRLVRETGVAIAPGVAFGADGEGYVRFCFAATEDTLARALERFRGFMAQRV